MNTTLWRYLATFGSMLVCLCALGCGDSSSPGVTAALPAPQAASDDRAEQDAVEVAAETPDTTGSPPAQAASEEPLRLAHKPATPTSYEPADKPKFDPIEVNGRYFVDWPKPKMALVISGRQDGYLEPCGCAGLDQQKGGISRRQALLKDLASRGWPLAAVDVGGLVRRFGRQAEIKFAISAESLKRMNYGAVGFGPDDLRLSAGEVVAAVAGADPADSIFVSANVSLFDLTPKTRIIEAGGMKLGVTSVLGETYQQQINNDEVVIQPAAEALEKVVGELAACDVRVLLAHATMAETKQLAAKFPQFDLVVASDGRDVPPLQPESLDGGKQHLVEVAPKGMYVIVAGFYDDREHPIRFQRVALDSRYPDSPVMKNLMATYQDQLRQLGWRDLGIKAVPHPATVPGEPLSGQFAGAASCKECHPTAWGIWSKTKHAHATETLAKLDTPRQFDAECISCHATGWNPQEFYPYTSGFVGLNETPLLAGNQCENCHGPAAAHVAAEAGRNRTKRDAERQKLKLTAGVAFENVCMKCHDHDNSPEFNEQSFQAHYWPKVEHKGKR